MRPLELDLTAFRSYDRATIDLRPHELVVITGDTGAGKTSLLDAICFAVFGRTPELGTSTDLLTLGREHGEVRLTFATRGEVWRVTRRYGTRAPEPRQLLERLADDGGAALETVAGTDAVGARLTATVGMGYKAFTSAVLLAQGRFAEFLTARPVDRDNILRELFEVASLDGARTAAQAAEAAAIAEAQMREGDGARLPPHGAGARTAAAREARIAAGRHAEALLLRPVADRMAAYLADAARSRARETAAREAAADLLDEPAAAALAARVVEARRGIEDAEIERGRRTEDHERAVRARDATRGRHGGGAADLAALRERAVRAGRIGEELPSRERDLTEREAALAVRAAGLGEQSAALTAAVADDERLRERAVRAAAWRARVEESAQAEAGLDASQEAEAVASARLRAAEHAVAVAEAAREAARLHDLASTVRAGLHPGDACPVCGNTFAHHGVDAAEQAAAELDLVRAREELGAATGAAAGAAERGRAARELAARIAAARDAAAALLTGTEMDDTEASPEALRQEALERMRAEVAAVDAEVRTEGARLEAERAAVARDRHELEAARRGLGAWDGLPAPVEALTGAIAEAHAVEAAADAAAAAVTVAADAATRAGLSLAELERGPIAALRTAAARAAARGRLEAPGDDATAQELIASASRLRVAATAAAADHAQRAAEATARAEEAGTVLATWGGGLEVDRPEQMEAAVRRLRAARETARARLAALEGTAASARRLAAEAREARERAQRHHQVALDLRANAFPRFLLARYRERLAIGASTHLQELSGGDFRFSGLEPDPMAVVDNRRGERLRPAGTLSGGERFLASLALALGLGDVAAESSGRLDCLFLDEGFSTLDAESLEQALAGVERLAGDGRLVGVITHLPGVAERLGATIRVAKDPEGVSRIVDQ